MTWRGCRTYEPGFGGGGKVRVTQACTAKPTEVQVRGRNPQERLSTCVPLHWRGDTPAPFRGVAFVVGTAASGGSDTGDSFVAITVCEGSGWWVGTAARGAADIVLVRGRNLSPFPPLVAFGESTAVASVVAASAVVSGPTPQHTAHVGLRHASAHGSTTPRHINLNGGGGPGGGSGARAGGDELAGGAGRGTSCGGGGGGSCE